jgi:hypothetical protein
MPSKHALLVHLSGLQYDSDSLHLFHSILSTGFRSRNSLVDLGVIPKHSVKGIFSDEHQNIYFFPETFFKKNPSICPTEQTCLNTIYIKAQDTVSVYNCQYRGDVSIFEYEASKISISNFLKQFESAQELKNKITTSGLEEIIDVVTHPLTGAPVMINKGTKKLLELFDLEDPDYGPEVIIPKDHIHPSSFYTTGHGYLYNSTLNGSVNIEAPIIEVPEMAHSRGLFLNNDGTEVYRPSKHHLESDFGNIELSSEVEYRYKCNRNVTKIFLSNVLSGNISFSYIDKQICTDDSVSVSCESKAYHKVIIGDTRDNSITFDPFSLYHVIGGKGSDQYIFTNSYANKIILDFNGADGDRMHLPDYLYKTATDAVNAVYYKGDMAILPIGDLGSVILPDLIAEITPEDIIIY